MQSGLGRREHEAAGLDGPRTQQRMPMRFPGLAGEGGRHREECGAAFRKRAVERRKAQIVADRQPNPAPRQVGDHGGLARLVIGRFAITLAAFQIDVEHVDLVVAREHVALGPDQEGAVDRLLRREAQCQRTDMKMDFQLAGERAVRFQRKIVLFGGDMLEQRLAVKLHHVAYLRGKHIVGALRGCLSDQSGALLEAQLGQKRGAHLHHRGSEGLIVAHGEAFSPVSIASSLPARSSA